MELDEVLSFVTKKSVPIVLLNWNVLKGKDGYWGHFVPIVGYDNNNVYIHNSGIKDAQKFMQMDKNLFNEARKSLGTDQDIVVIYRN